MRVTAPFYLLTNTVMFYIAAVPLLFLVLLCGCVTSAHNIDIEGQYAPDFMLRGNQVRE